MRHKRITYVVWPLDGGGDFFCWVPGLYRWIPRRSAFDPDGPVGNKRFRACAESRTFARAIRIAHRYPGRKIRIERRVNDRPVRSWTLMKERT